MTYFELLLLTTGFLAILAGLAWLADRGMDAPVKQPARPRPAPVEEINFEEEIQDFIGGRGLTRTAVALARSTNEGRDVSASGPLTSKEPIHASENQ